MKEIKYIETLLAILKDAKLEPGMNLLEVVNAVNWLVGVRANLQSKELETQAPVAEEKPKKKVK